MSYSKLKKIVFLLLIWIGIFNIKLNAEQAVSDSTLEKKKAEIHISKAKVFGWNQIDSMLKYATACLKIADKYNFDSLKFEALNEMAYAHYITRRTSEGISVGLEALRIAKSKNNPIWQAKASNRLGLLYQNSNKFGESIIFFEQALKIYGWNTSTQSNGNLYNNLANSYLKLNDFKNALKFRKLAIAIRTKIQDTSGLGDSYNDIGETFIMQEEYDSALYYLNAAYLIKVKQGDVELLSIINMNKAEVYMNLKNWDKAILLLSESELQAKRIKATNYLKDIYLKKSICFKNINQIAASYHYLELHRIYNDSVNSIENKRQLNALNEQFQSERKTLEIKNLIREKEQSIIITKEKDLRKNLVLLFSLLFLLATGLFSYFLYKRFQITRFQKETIENQKFEVDEKNKSITDSINYAKRIQDAMLPEVQLRQKLFPKSFVLFLPKDIVSGDFYWFAEKNDCYYAAVADCTGHGVPGAFMSMIGNAFLNEIINHFPVIDPAFVLDELRKKIIHALKQEGKDSESKDGMDIALISYNKSKKNLSFAGANNPIWIISQSDGAAVLTEIKADKQPIGVHHNLQKPFSNHEIKVNVGDLIYIFSDGFADQFGGKDEKKFKYKNMKNLLLEIANQSMEEQRNSLFLGFNAWKGNLEQVDDVLVIGIQIS